MGPVKLEAYGHQAGACSDDQIVFQRAMIAVVDQVNSGIDLFVGNPGIGWQIGAPACGVVTEKVVDRSGQAVQCSWLDGGGSIELHRDYIV